MLIAHRKIGKTALGRRFRMVKAELLAPFQQAPRRIEKDGLRMTLAPAMFMGRPLPMPIAFAGCDQLNGSST